MRDCHVLNVRLEVFLRRRLEDCQAALKPLQEKGQRLQLVLDFPGCETLWGNGWGLFAVYLGHRYALRWWWWW